MLGFADPHCKEGKGGKQAHTERWGNPNPKLKGNKGRRGLCSAHRSDRVVGRVKTAGVASRGRN